MKTGTFSKFDKVEIYELIEARMPTGTLPSSIQEAIDNAEELLDVYSAPRSTENYQCGHNGCRK